MASSPRIIRTPKSYYQTRRTQGHSDWAFAFWRELFQNEVDAGADTIRIDVRDAKGKGSFGRDATVDDVVRVVFEGNGRGMDGAVLENVFFSPGETTKKDGNTTGGFGTARLMLCFSQVRYAIRTQDWIVEGDGSEYTCQKVDDALAAARLDLASLSERMASLGADTKDGSPDADEEGRALLTEFDAALARVHVAEVEALAGHFKGCRFEIDVDPKEEAAWYRQVDRRKLLDTLERYLSMSQLPCRVFVNGEQSETQTLRGPAKRRLSVDDGDIGDFATVHTSQGEKARHKGKVVVRVRGAVMFTEDTSSTHQIVVEIDPSRSRDVLTDNRDGMKDPYRRILAGFVEEIATDTKSALKEKSKERFINVRGGKGSRILALSILISKMDMASRPGSSRTKELPKAKLMDRASYEETGFSGIPVQVVESLFETASEDVGKTFLAGYGNPQEVASLVDDARSRGSYDALASASPELVSYLVGNLGERFDEVLHTEGGKSDDRPRDTAFDDMHDVMIHVSGDSADDDKIKNAVRRHHPNYWRRIGQPLQGRGMEAAMLLAVWGVACKYSMKALLQARPGIAREKGGTMKWATGWVFDKQKPWEEHRTGAELSERNGVHNFLLNPITDAYEAAFDIRKERRDDASDRTMGLQDIDSIAIHETAHVVKSRHDEEFANVQTTILGLYDRVAARREMAQAVDAVRETFGKGKARIQAMLPSEDVVVLTDEEPASRTRRAAKPRPAERLLAHAVPMTAMLAGTLATDENADFPAPALRNVLPDAVRDLGDGVVEVDCDRLASLEYRIADVMREDGLARNAAIAPDASEVPDAAPMDDDPIDLDAFLDASPAETAQVVASDPDDVPLDLDALVAETPVPTSPAVPAFRPDAPRAASEPKRPEADARPFGDFGALLASIGREVAMEMNAPVAAVPPLPVAPPAPPAAVRRTNRVLEPVVIERAETEVVYDPGIEGLMDDEFDMSIFETPAPRP